MRQVKVDDTRTNVRHLRQKKHPTSKNVVTLKFFQHGLSTFLR